MEGFAERLKNLRKDASLTQSQFSEKLDVHLQTVSKWERGLSMPDLSLLGEIATVLHVTIEELVGLPKSENGFTGNFSQVEMGKAIATARKIKGESQKSLAGKLYVTADAVSRWERGNGCPDLDTLVALSAYFELPFSQLYYGIEPVAVTPAMTAKLPKKRKSFVWLIPAVCCALCLAVVFFFIFYQPQLPSAQLPSDNGGVINPDEGGEQLPPDGNETPDEGGEQLPPDENETPDEGGEQLPPDGNETPDEGGGTPLPEEPEPKFCTVEYVLNGGTQNEGNVMQVEVGKYAPLYAPTQEGYIFLGWYDNAEKGVKYTTVQPTEEGTLTLYAKWDYLTYPVVYELYDGVQNTDNPEKVRDIDYLKNGETGEWTGATLYDPMKEGYIFLGWYDENFEIVYTAIPKPQNGQTVTLYAKWEKLVVPQDCPFTYQISGGEVEILTYTGEQGVDVVFPAQIDGYPVTKISCRFNQSNESSYRVSYASITIPEGIRVLGNEVFRNIQVDELVVPASVEEIGNYCFASSDASFSFAPDSRLLSLGNYSFWYCTEMTELILPQGLETIGESAFNGCKMLTGFDIPKSVKEIGMFAFYGCKSITSIVFPQNVTVINESMLYDCELIESVVFEGNVEKIGANAIRGLKKLKSIEFPNSLHTIESQAFLGCSSLESVVVPENVTQLGSSAFLKCSKLARVEILAPLKTLESAMFSNCSALKEVILADSIETLGDTVFNGCSSLKSITLPQNLITIGERTFGACGLTEMVIPNGVISIGAYAFSNCTALRKVTVSATVTKIGKRAFAWISSLSSVVFENPNGWYEGETAISSEALSSPSTAANYMKNQSDEWTREEII